MNASRSRPTVREGVVILAVIVLIQVFDLVTHLDVIAASATAVICAAVIASWIWSNRRRS
jgi:uncharacterized membrane protein YfcA